MKTPESNQELAQTLMTIEDIKTLMKKTAEISTSGTDTKFFALDAAIQTIKTVMQYDFSPDVLKLSPYWYSFIGSGLLPNAPVNSEEIESDIATKLTTLLKENIVPLFKDES